MFRSALASLIVASVGFLLSDNSKADERVEFSREVRPILSDKCFSCHGPDSDAREADLRLDLRSDAVADRGGYQVIVPEKPDASELVTRIDSDDDSDQMPPPEFGKPLTDQERATLKSWIAQGASWQEHWSLALLKRPAIPAATMEPPPESPIDRFILARLQSEGLTPSPGADRRVLIRRLHIDLTGLPPTPDEVQQFTSDDSSQAYEQLVDRLLASPHYGERMAMYWLDVVRYADSLGYHGDQPHSVSPYRDYVIEAFNSNMPFDQFATENLAGDLLPDATLMQRVASTYNRLNRASGEGGVQPKEYLAKYAADRVRTAGSVWLGSTIGCAECHDHKFDPFTTKDFYRLAAFFADIKEQGIVTGAVHIEQLPVPSPEQQQRLDHLDSLIASAGAELQRRTPAREKLFAQWQQRMQQAGTEWKILKPETMTSAGGATFELKDDNSILITGTNPDKDTYTVTAKAPPGKLSGIRLEVLHDPSLPGGGPGRAGNGNFVLQRFELLDNEQLIKWKSATATHSQDQYAINNLVSSNNTGWAILPQAGKDQQAVLVTETTADDNAEDTKKTNDARLLKFVITQDHGAQHTLGRFRLYSSSRKDLPAAGEILPTDVSQALTTGSTDRSPEQVDRLWSYFQQHGSALRPERERIAKLRSERDAVRKAVVTTLASTSGEPREMRVLPRGDWMDDSGEVVQPGVPHFLRQPEVGDRRLNRLDLAKWITAPDNPLVARTLVNRLWMLFFGQGISKSVEDLGSQGQWPTHPELLDWLAIDLIDTGWDVKHMIKLMVMSNAYRQSSVPRPDLKESDPYNSLLARQSRWRVEAEMVRDNALSVCGVLEPRIGGPSVKPYQPAGYWAQLNFPKRTYQHDAGASQYRRGLYTHWQRTFLHPSLLAFDAPVREECTSRRDRSNTPLQALVLLNDPTFVEAARLLAARIMHEGGQAFDSKLHWTYMQVLQRSPTDDERQVMRGFYDRNKAVYQAAPEAAKKLTHIGAASIDEDIDLVEHAAWTCVARAIFNLHETITRY